MSNRVKNTAGDGATPAGRRPSSSRRPPARTARKRPRRWWQGPWPLVGTLVVVAGIVAAFILLNQGQSAAPAPAAAETTQVVNAVSQVPQATTEAVGSGGLTNPLKAVSGSPLAGANGKPQVLYIGAEFCPYCAGERWSVVQALSRFGSFSNLALSTSSSTDINPNTPTFTFYGSHYTSSTIDFSAVETETREQAPLESVTAQQQALMSQYNPAGSIPFLDIGNRYVAVGSGFDINVLSGKSWTEIAQALNNPSSPIAKAIIGNANYLTAAICKTTNNQPSSVCGAPAIKQLGGQLG